MSADIALNATKRDVVGKKVKALRSQGQIPAVIHDHGNDSVVVSVDEAEFNKVFSSAGRHHPVQIKVDGKAYTTLIKEVTHKPATAKVFHTVFQAIKANVKVSAELPVHIVGDAPAERTGLIVLKKLEHVQVEALPKDLIDAVEISAESLVEVGDKLTVADLKVPASLVITTDAEQTIIVVEAPRVQEEPEETEEASTEEAEGGEGEAKPTEETKAENDD